MSDPLVIDFSGTNFNLAGLAQLLDLLNHGNDVTIKNCTGGEMLTLGLYLMAEYERARDHR